MNSINSTSKLRLTGLSGFDTDSMITQLMNAEKIPLNGLYQKRTVVEWKRDAYRGVTNTLRGFKSSFFDVVNRSSYILSQNAIKTMSAKTSGTSYLDVSASSDAQAGSSLVKVLQVATGDKATTETKISQDITGSVTKFDLLGKKIGIALDGVTKEIALEDYTSDDIAIKLQASLDTAFGAGKLSVGFSSGKLTLGTTGGATKVTVTNPSSGSGLADLGLVAGASNRISTTATLADLASKFKIPLPDFSVGGTVDFTINGKLISANATDTLSKVFENINNTVEANVTIKYDELTDKVTVTSKQLGDGNNLNMEDIGTGFLESLGIDTAHAIRVEGQDAKIKIGTQEVVRSTNSFSLNGVTYTLKTAHPDAVEGDTVTVEQDVDTAYNNIKSFIDKYNEMIDNLNGKVNEKYDRDYLPLSDEQKDTMSEKDIENWEKKAKTGLLKNDSILQKIALDMRRALSDAVEGTGLTLKDIGIASQSYIDRGKLTIDEDKLKEALKSKPDDVARLLNGVDPNNPTYSRTATAEARTSRYQNSGLFQRISDIVENNISTIRDTKGSKGILLVKAGIDGDMSFSDNLLEDELDNYDKRISIMLDKLNSKEESYYLKFSKMETLLNQMNSQSAWLTSQFSSGQQ